MKRQSLWLKIFKNIPSNFYPNSSKSIDLNATFQDGRTAFMVACEKGNLNIEERDFVWFSNTVKCCLKIGEFMKHQVFLKMCMVWQIITILPRFLKSFFSQHFQTECVWCRLEAFCHFRLIHAYLMTSHLFNQLGLYKESCHIFRDDLNSIQRLTISY